MSLMHHVVFGGDVSEYQRGLRLPDVFTFVYVKCTEGQRTTDPEYDGFKEQAQHGGKLFAAYHFLHSDSNPITQAEHFMTTEPDKRIPVVVDVEESGTSKPGVPHLEAFTNAIRNAGRVASMYYPRWWWERTGSRNLSHLHMPLIASEYPSSTPGLPHELYKHVPDSYWERYGGVAPTILQFADSGRFTGFSGEVDLNAFRGTREQLVQTGIFHDFGRSHPVRVEPSPPVQTRLPLQEQIDHLRRRVAELERKVNHV